MKKTLIILLFLTSLMLVLSGCKNSNQKENNKNTGTVSTTNDQVDDKKQDDDIKKPIESEDTLSEEKEVEKNIVDKTYEEYNKEYAKFYDDDMVLEDWWLYSTKDIETIKQIYRLNVKTGERVKVCRGVLPKSIPLKKKIYFIDEQGVWLLHKEEKIKLVDKYIHKYKILDDGFLYVIDKEVFFYHIGTEKERLIDTFNSSIQDISSALIYNDYLYYSVGLTNNKHYTYKFNIKTNEIEMLIENDHVKRLVENDDTIYFFGRKLYSYKEGKIQNIDIDYNGYKVISKKNKLYFVGKELYVLNTQTKEIMTLNIPNDYYLKAIKGNKVYLQGTDMLIYNIGENRYSSKKVAIEGEIYFREDAIYFHSDYIWGKVSYDNDKKALINTDYNITNMIIGNVVYIIDSNEVMHKFDKNSFDRLENSRRYNNSYIYVKDEGSDTLEYQLETFSNKTHLSKDIYFPSSDNRLQSVLEDKKAIDIIGKDINWYAYNDKFITYVDNDDNLYYYNRYTKDTTLLRTGNMTQLRVINNCIYYYSEDKKALFYYKNGIHKQIVDGNITKYEVVGNKVYYEDEYLYRVNMDGSQIEKINDSEVSMLLSIKDSIIYIEKADVFPLYRITNQDKKGKLIRILPVASIEEYFTDDEKLYIYFKAIEGNVLDFTIDSVEFGNKLFENDKIVIFQEALSAWEEHESILAVYDKETYDYKYIVRDFNANIMLYKNWFYFMQGAYGEPALLRININDYKLEKIHECNQITDLEPSFDYIVDDKFLVINDNCSLEDASSEKDINIYQLENDTFLGRIEECKKIGFLLNNCVYYIASNGLEIKKYNMKESIVETFAKEELAIEYLEMGEDSIVYGSTDNKKQVKIDGLIAEDKTKNLKIIKLINEEILASYIYDETVLIAKENEGIEIVRDDIITHETTVIYKGKRGLEHYYEPIFKGLNNGDIVYLDKDRYVIINPLSNKLISEVFYPDGITDVDISYNQDRLTYVKNYNLYISDIDFTNERLIREGTYSEEKFEEINVPSSPMWSKGDSKILYSVGCYEGTLGVEIYDMNSENIDRSFNRVDTHAKGWIDDFSFIIGRGYGSDFIDIINTKTKEVESLASFYEVEKLDQYYNGIGYIVNYPYTNNEGEIFNVKVNNKGVHAFSSYKNHIYYLSILIGNNAYNFVIDTNIKNITWSQNNDYMLIQWNNGTSSIVNVGDIM